MSIAASATAPVGWAKAHPAVFAVLIIVGGLVVVRFRTKLYGLPVLGPVFKAIAGGA